MRPDARRPRPLQAPVRHPAALLPLCAALLAGCESYRPEPVDLDAHARAFATRLDDTAVRTFVERLRAARPDAEFDLSDGMSLREAQLLALWFHPDLRQARLRAGVALANAENAGLLADPQLGANFQRILESAPEDWVYSVGLGLTIPLSGRLGLEQQLAGREHDEALVAARLAEADVLDRLARAWVHWSAAGLRLELLDRLVDELQALEATVGRLVEAGQLTQFDARPFALERLARQLEQQQQRAEVADRSCELRALIGLPPGAAIDGEPVLALEPGVASPAARRQQLRDGPELALSRARHEVAERRLELEIRKQWPDLQLYGGPGEEDRLERLLFGFTLPLPLWNRNAQAIATAAAARDLAAETLRGDLERALQTLERYELRQQAAQRQRRAVEEQLVPLAAQQLRDGRRLIELGRLDTLLLLDALLRGHEARSAALDAAVAEAMATAALNRLFWPDLSVAPLEAAR